MEQIKIGKFIAELRKEKNMTQTNLADKLGVSFKTVSKWETGRGMPDSSVMLELCKYLNINVNELLSGERITEEKYREKANENIVSMAKEVDKNKKIKNRMIKLFVITIIGILILLLVLILYRNIEIGIDYDSRLIECKITDNNIICSFNGLSLVHFEYEEISIDNETLIFINGKILLENKIRSHFETWDSMAQLNNDEQSYYSSGRQINKNIDLSDCKEKIKVYYTNVSLSKIKKANKNELKEIILQSHLIAEQ